MLRKFLFLGLLCVVAPNASAGLFASAFLGVSDAKIEYFDAGAGDWVTAVEGVHFTTSAPSAVSSATAILSGHGFVESGVLPGLDSAAYLDSLGGTGPATPADIFAAAASGSVPTGASVSYALASTRGLGGSLVDPMSGPVPGASVDIVASSEIDGSSVGDSTAFNNASIGANITFGLTVGIEGMYRVAGDYELDLVSSSSLVPAGGAELATSWIVGIESAGFGTFDESDLPAELNRTTSLGSDIQEIGTFATGAFDLESGTYDVSINSASSVMLAVPEPGSMLAFAGLGLVGLARRRRRN